MEVSRSRAGTLGDGAEVTGEMFEAVGLGKEQ